jgi:hypothetical protein
MSFRAVRVGVRRLQSLLPDFEIAKCGHPMLVPIVNSVAFNKFLGTQTQVNREDPF